MVEPPKGEKDVFDVDRIRRMIDLMKEYDLSELDLRQDEQQIRLVRGGAQGVIAASSPAVLAGPQSTAPVALSGSSASSDALDGPHIVTIKSPMVGTFFDRPNPKADPFVKVGSVIAGDTIVCIVEAMKVFNEIPAECSGKVVAVLVSNEQPVDFNLPLFKLDTRG